MQSIVKLAFKGKFLWNKIVTSYNFCHNTQILYFSDLLNE